MPGPKTDKKRYRKPRLTRYGKITELTAAKAAGAEKDGVANKKT